MPTLLILLFTLLIMVTVIPYAFASVFRQLEAVKAMEAMSAGEDITQRTLHCYTYISSSYRVFTHL